MANQVPINQQGGQEAQAAAQAAQGGQAGAGAGGQQPPQVAIAPGVNAAVAAGMDQDLYDFLTNVLGFNQAKVDCMQVQGYESFGEFRDWSEQQIRDFVKQRNSVPANRGGCNFGDSR